MTEAEKMSWTMINGHFAHSELEDRLADQLSECFEWRVEK